MDTTLRPINSKEQKELDKMNARIAAIDMERAELIRQIRENSVFAVQYIKQKIASLIGKYFDTPNKDLIYLVNAGELEFTKTPHRVSGKSSMTTRDIKNYKVIMNVTKYGTTGEAVNSKYEIVSGELPKDVDKWLTMGNSVISQADAKKYINAALVAEKKALQARILEINAKLK